MFLPHPRVKVSVMGSLRDREVACSASDRQGSNFEFCVWRTVSSQSSHHPQEVLLAQFSLYLHKGGLKPDSFHFHWSTIVLFTLNYTYFYGTIFFIFYGFNVRPSPANTKHLYNICTTSAPRRWFNIVQMVYKCFVFAENPFKKCV